jgi:AcrR family transcriptional regulator
MEVVAGMTQIASRRERVRAATSQEIIQTARRLLVRDGSTAISLRAIAREMGMTAPALYRYYGSHEELIEHVIADIFTELADYLQAQIAQLQSSPSSAEAVGSQLVTACQAFRDWALAHPAEFGMIFGSPLPVLDLASDDPVALCGFRFGQVFLTLYEKLWQLSPFTVPPDDEISPAIAPQLAHYRELIGSALPLGALQTFLRCWVLLYGTVSLEVFGHLRFALDDAAPMFDMMLTDLALMIGLNYPLNVRLNLR